MPKTINIQTNRKEIAIQRDGENVGSIYFSPSDFSIIKRLREVQKKLADFKVFVEDKENLDEMLEEADRADKEFRDAIDYAFDYPCSDVVFGAGYSFTTRKGVSALEQFLEAAIDYIADEVDKEAKASQKRQDKYLSKYAK